MDRVRCLAGALCALMLAACGERDAININDPFSAAVVRLGDAVAAEVNGTPIYISDVRRAGLDLGLVEPSEQLDPASDRFAYILDWLIQRRLLALEARKRGLDQAQEVRRRLAAAREAILYDILVETVEEDSVSEDALRKFYQERLQFPPGEDVHARLIVTRTLDEAKRLVALARRGDADFAQLAMEYSVHDATRLEGGDLGYFGRGELPVEEIETVAFATPVGEVSDPFRSRFGWHIVRVEDRRRSDHESFEELRPQLAEWLRKEARAGLIETLTEPGRTKVVRHVGPSASDAVDAPEGADLGAVSAMSAEPSQPASSNAPALRP